MKYFVFWTILMLSFGCSNPRKIVATEEISKEHLKSSYLYEDVIYDHSLSLWLRKRDSLEVSGVIVSHFENGIISKIISVNKGKKQGPQITYFPNGSLKFYEVFEDGRLEGEVKRWGIQEGYRLLAVLNYTRGKLNGEQKKWYNTGELHKVLNMKMGVEVGMQRAYRKNGAMYANYESRNGRTFGMRRSNLCYELKNEEIVYQQ